MSTNPKDRERTKFPRMKLTPKQRAFLVAYAKCGNLSHAARVCRTERKAHYDWLQSSVTYPDAFKQAHEEACERLEQEARRRAMDGVGRKVFYKGVPVIDPETGEQYVERYYSDALLIRLLTAFMPEKYADKREVSQKIEQIHSSNKTIQIDVTTLPLELCDMLLAHMDKTKKQQPVLEHKPEGS